jgi:probable F420-dependent oxidoreductase
MPERVESAYPYAADGSMSWPRSSSWPDCWVAIGAMAAATQKLRFTTSVFIAPLRDVVILAKAIGTAAGFAAGRLSCGFGAGWMKEEFDVVGQPFATRGARLDEMITALRLLWSGENVSFDGAHVAFPPVCMCPAVGHIPVLVGGNTAPALRRAAANDGWIGTYTDLHDVTRMLAELDARRIQLGRTRATDGFATLLAAMPGASRDAVALDELGVDGLIIPAVALAGVATGTPLSTADVIIGMEKFAERRIGSGR